MLVVKYGTSFEQRYYVRTEPELKVDKLQFSYLSGLENKEFFLSISETQVVSRDWSPQSKLADEFKPILSNESKLSQWETVMLDLVNGIFRQSEMDPILQLILLKNVVESAGEGSEPLRVSLEPLRASLEAIKNQFDKVKVNWGINWLNPETPRLLEIQDEARRVIPGLRAKVPPAKTVLETREQMEQTLSRTYRTVGWLARDRDGYQVRHGTVVPPEGDLLVVAPLTNQGCEWKKVGIIDGGTPKLDPRR